MQASHESIPERVNLFEYLNQRDPIGPENMPTVILPWKIARTPAEARLFLDRVLDIGGNTRAMIEGTGIN